MLRILLSAIYFLHKLRKKQYPLAIIYFHHVFPKHNEYHSDDITDAAFDKKIIFLKKHFNIIDLEQALTLQKQRLLPPKSLVITFDDGYEDNYTCAAPILNKHQCTATFFIATQGIEDGLLWNDKIEQIIKQSSVKSISSKITGKELQLSTKSDKVHAFSVVANHLKFLNNTERNTKILQLSAELKQQANTRTMMNKEQLLALHQQGFNIGAHTHSHTILSTETDDNVEKELKTNKQYLEAIIQQPVNLIAYPNGLFGRDYLTHHCDISKKLGFKYGLSTNDGGALVHTNSYQIPRFMPYRKQLPLFALSIAKIAGEHV